MTRAGWKPCASSDAGFALTQGYNNVGLLVEQIAGPLSALPEEVRFCALTGDHRNEHITRAGALAHRTYLWDRAHRAIAVNDRITGEKRFDYDQRGQVVGVQRLDRRGGNPVLSRFGYDPNQNLTEIATGMARKVVQDAGRVRQRGQGPLPLRQRRSRHRKTRRGTRLPPARLAHGLERPGPACPPGNARRRGLALCL
ncbi:hypothetical protein PE067_16465 [Paracoccus sp. DMF-8]|uniref:hypothetical protein n=1 Tax=Paracoccus sp. DMF-8 TaxID=3019445 RepID=UPI0023E428CF|nr:hypothetical protein [Paracoccus sp. DMF-8]MDF3607599.1 hypothetical protein [Paracoccus sp. DMF-8]